MTIDEGKKEVALFMKRAYDRGLTTATGGNISLLLDSIMLITPSGKDKSSLVAADIAEVDLKTGKNLTPDKRLSIETGMHRNVYLARPDVFAVVHSHPVFACLFSASEERINTAIIAESYYLLDEVIKIPYELMGSAKLAEAAGKYAEKHNALLLENHGAIAFGKTLLSAFDRLECLEQSAKLTFLSKSLPISQITESRLRDIAAMR